MNSLFEVVAASIQTDPLTSSLHHNIRTTIKPEGPPPTPRGTDSLSLHSSPLHISYRLISHSWTHRLCWQASRRQQYGRRRRRSWQEERGGEDLGGSQEKPRPYDAATCQAVVVAVSHPIDQTGIRCCWMWNVCVLKGQRAPLFYCRFFNSFFMFFFLFP